LKFLSDSQNGSGMFGSNPFCIDFSILSDIFCLDFFVNEKKFNKSIIQYSIYEYNCL